MFTFFRKKFAKLSNYYSKRAKQPNLKGFSKNPFFCFGVASLVLCGLLFFYSDSLAGPGYLKAGKVAFFKDTNNLRNNDLFFSKNKALALETPDLKIIQDNSIYAVSTPTILTTQTLGDIFGGQDQQRKEVINYAAQAGDTIQSIADNFKVSADTVRTANDLSENAGLKVGQTLTILPVSGVVHVVKNGDTISQVAKTYKANISDITSFNSLVNEEDIFIGDTLIIPNGITPQKPVPSFIQVPLADNFFIYPSEGQITQGIHYYNAVDLANKCGTSIYASASGIVQRAASDGKWHGGMGNHISILHSNGTVTYYGHLEALFVKHGDNVNVGDRIALMGGQPGMSGAGKSTGCHLHFEVIGSQNPLSKHAVGSTIKYK